MLNRRGVLEKRKELSSNSQPKFGAPLMGGAEAALWHQIRNIRNVVGYLRWYISSVPTYVNLSKLTR